MEELHFHIQVDVEPPCCSLGSRSSIGCSPSINFALGTVTPTVITLGVFIYGFFSLDVHPTSAHTSTLASRLRTVWHTHIGRLWYDPG